MGSFKYHSKKSDVWVPTKGIHAGLCQRDAVSWQNQVIKTHHSLSLTKNFEDCLIYQLANQLLPDAGDATLATLKLVIV